MSANIVVTWPDALVCVSDRRLTDLTSGAVQTNRSTKLTVFRCADAHGVITYNGIGRDDAGQTPSDWIMTLAEAKLFDGPLNDVLDGIGTDLSARLVKFRGRQGAKAARHTFMVGAWCNDEPWIHGISNYESVEHAHEEPDGSEEVLRSSVHRDATVIVVATGAKPRQADVRAISGCVKRGGDLRAVKDSCVAAIRRIAMGRRRRRTVGASCQWAILDPNEPIAWSGFDAPGGIAAEEPPQLINIAGRSSGGRIDVGGPGMLIKDVLVGGGPVRSVDTVKERPCPICGDPWPMTHKACETCLRDQSARNGRHR